MMNVGWRVAARGIWLYNRTVPHTIEIYARPAKFAGSRFKEPDENTPEPDTADGFVFDENAPIPDTPDGFVYYVSATSGGEFHSVEDAKRWADAQPWGPVKWDEL
jgi:hypothetical protein